MNYSFNTEIATRYGVDEAIFVHNLYWWIVKNRDNNHNFIDGRYWTYNTMTAFAEQFPFFSVARLRGIIARLRATGAVIISNYNRTAFDHTLWYSLGDDIMAIYEPPTTPSSSAESADSNAYNPPSEAQSTVETAPSVLANRFAKINKSICENQQIDLRNDSVASITYINPDIIYITPKPPAGTRQAQLLGLITASPLSENLQRAIGLWCAHKKHKMSDLELNTLLSIVATRVAEHGEQAIVGLIEECISNGYKGIIWDKLRPRFAASAQTAAVYQNSVPNAAISAHNALFDGLNSDDM